MKLPLAVLYQRLLFLCPFLFWVNALHAQDSLQRPVRDTSRRTVRDSTRKGGKDSSLFSLFGDEHDHKSVAYVHSIEKAYETLNKVQNEAGLSFSIQGIAREVTDDDSALKMMRTAVRSRNTNISIRNLQLYREIVLDIQRDIIRDRKVLDANNAKLENLEGLMRTLSKDAQLSQLMKDTVALNEQKRKLRRLQGKWRRADSLLQSSFDTLTFIRSEAADNSISASELVNRINTRLRRNGIAAMGKEYNYLWEADSNNTIRKDSAATLTAIRVNANKVLRYYVAQRTGKLILFLLCFGVFLWWVSRAYRNLKQNSATADFINQHLEHLTGSRLAAAIIVMCSFMPFFDIYAPSSFIEIMQLICILTVSYIFRKRWPAKVWIYWVGLVALFGFYFLLSNAPITLGLRCLLIVLNLVSIVLAILFLRNLRGDTTSLRLIKAAGIIHIVLNVAAIFSNLYGRVTIAQTFRNTGIYGLTQMVALAVCFHLLKEAVLLQIQSSRLRRGILRPFDASQVTGSLRLPLMIIICIIWLIMFAVNINIYAPIKSALTLQLNTPVSIGSAAFTPGSVLLFFAIIWIAHLLQRYTGYIFGDVGFEEDEEENKEQRSKMLISKLLILTIGYFLAVAASGLPVDKITIVLGALGVGIGLGLQNIVSNFISGIILIFDRPLQIGDSIEVGNKAGKVKEIGMRSSTLLTPEGAEVIIPNGDILSQQITNWTLSNNYRRLELMLALKTERSKDEVLPLISEIIQSSSLVYNEREPVVLIDSMKEGEMGIKIFFWCSDIYKADQVKSELRYLLYTKLREHDIKMG